MHMDRFKPGLKVIGAEALYLLTSAIVAGLAALIQMIGRTYEGDYSSFIWSGSNYRYNALFYIIGLVLFVGFMIAGYKLFLHKMIIYLSQSGIVLKILFFSIALIFSIAVLAIIVMCYFLITGLTDNLKPEFMAQVTGLGWPIFTLVFMIVIGIRNCRKDTNNSKRS